MKAIVQSITFIALLFISSCASTGSSGTEQLLSAAGFVSRTPENANQRQLYTDLPAYKVHRGTYNNKVIYAYKNEKEGIAYIGNEAAYQSYQRLAVQRNIANDYRAAEMNRSMAYGWYGAYGGYMGRPVYVIHH